MAPRQYSREEMQAILAKALERQSSAQGDTFEHTQLLETATELGLSQAEVDAAIADVASARQRDAAVAGVLARRRRGVIGHGVAYLAVNLGLWGIDLATESMGVNPQGGWHWIVAASWGIGLVMHAWRALSQNPEELARAAEKQRIALQRRARQKEMEHAIETAVTDVVTTSADALSRILKPHDRDRRR